MKRARARRALWVFPNFESRSGSECVAQFLHRCRLDLSDALGRHDLETWLEGWSRCLGEINYQRTGYVNPQLLDVHIITDDDIARNTSFAAKIGAVTDAALELPLGKD